MMQFFPKSRVWVVGPVDGKLRRARRRGFANGFGALGKLALSVLRFVARRARRTRSSARRAGPVDITRGTRDQNWRLNCVPLPLALLATPREVAGGITLALGDGFSVSLAVFQLVFSAIVSITLWRLSAWQRRYEGLEGKLHETTTRLVDERFRAMTHEINGHVQGLLLALEEMKVRIQNGDVELRGLGERDQRIELAVAAKIDLLKDYIRDFAAGKKDLEKHECAFERKLGTVEQKLVDLASTVAVISERVRE
jgi:hypothetical protein